MGQSATTGSSGDCFTHTTSVDSTWNTAAAKAHLGPTPQDGWPSQAEVASFSTALDNWIAAQEEQVNAIRSCMNTVDQATCLQAAASQNSGGWLDAQSHLVIAYQSMTKGTKMGASGAPPSFGVVTEDGEVDIASHPGLAPCVGADQDEGMDVVS